VHEFGEFFDFHRLREIGAEPGNRFRDAVHAGFGKAHLSDAKTNGTAEQPDQNLVHRKWGEQIDVSGVGETLHQPGRGLDNGLVNRSDVNGAALLNGRHTARKNLQDQFGNLVRVEIEPESEVRFGMAGARDLRCNR